MIEFHAAILIDSCVLLDRPSRALVAYYLECGGMPLHDEVWINGTNGAANPQVPRNWANGFIKER